MKIELDYKIIGISVLFTGLLSYGLTPLIPFINGLCLLGSMTLLALSYLFILKPYTASQKENDNLIKQNDMEEVASMLSEMDEVIKEYEAMLSEQVVQLPCNCGKPLFEGILIPNAENICECSSCKEKFKVLISYDSILMTDPVDTSAVYNDIDKLERESINKTLE